MTRTLVVIPIALIVALGVSLLGQQMVQNVPAAAEAAERLLNRGGASVAAPAISISIPMPEAPKFADRELHADEILILAILTQYGPDRVLYGTENGGRVAFSKSTQVPLGGTNRTYAGIYTVVFGVVQWNGMIPAKLGPVLAIAGPDISAEYLYRRYCTSRQIFPFPEHIKSYDAPDPANQGWDRGPCQ